MSSPEFHLIAITKGAVMSSLSLHFSSVKQTACCQHLTAIYRMSEFVNGSILNANELL